MISSIHDMGMNIVRGHLGQRPGKSAWLTSQRNIVRALHFQSGPPLTVRVLVSHPTQQLDRT